MASGLSNSIKRGQVQLNCQLCEEAKKIRWKCIDCSLLLCDKCKDNIHPKFKNSEEHKVIDIKDVGSVLQHDTEADSNEINCEDHDGQKFCLYCGTCHTFVCPLCISQTHNGHKLVPMDQSKVPGNEKLTEIELTVHETFITHFPIIAHLSPTGESRLWISSGAQGTLWKVKIEQNKFKETLTFDIKVHDMAVTQSNDLLISTGESLLKKISKKTGRLKDSKYNVDPFKTRAVHITRGEDILIGVQILEGKTERQAVTILDKTGTTKKFIEYAKSKQLFTKPYRITTTAGGNICVLDQLSIESGRLVVLNKDGKVLNFYNGKHEENSFNPRGLVTTPSDKIILADMVHHSLHFLSNCGDFLTCLNTKDFGISYPVSMGFSITDKFYIGCGTIKDNAKVYEVQLTEY